MLKEFDPFVRWLEWVDSHDGRLHRRQCGGSETDFDIAGLIPTQPGQSVLTVGDLRALVECGKELEKRRCDG